MESLQIICFGFGTLWSSIHICGSPKLTSVLKIGKAFYLNDAKTMTAEQFCKDKIAEEGFCFRGTMEKLPADENCKCADHQCHVPQFDLGISTDDKAKGSFSDSSVKRIKSTVYRSF
jgi:hypothetical protein